MKHHISNMLLLELSLGICNVTLHYSDYTLFLNSHSCLLMTLAVTVMFYTAIQRMLRLPDTLAAASKIVELLKTVPPCRNNEGLKPVCE